MIGKGGATGNRTRWDRKLKRICRLILYKPVVIVDGAVRRVPIGHPNQLARSVNAIRRCARRLCGGGDRGRCMHFLAWIGGIRGGGGGLLAGRAGTSVGGVIF